MKCFSRANMSLLPYNRYLFNTLFVDDYLCWIQSLSDVSVCKKLDLLASKIRREIQGFDKQATGWNLDALEEAALAEADAMHPTDSGQRFRPNCSIPIQNFRCEALCMTHPSPGHLLQ